jgi:hypothetical protein
MDEFDFYEPTGNFAGEDRFASDPNEKKFDALLSASENGQITLTGADGKQYTYRLDPEDRSVTVLQGEGVSRDTKYTMSDDKYGEVLRNIEKDKFDLDPGDSFKQPIVDKDPNVGQLTGDLATEEALQKAQRDKTAKQLGILAAGEAIAQLVTALPTQYEKDLKKLKGKDPEGLTAEQKKMMMKAQLAPVAAMSRGSMMAQQAAMASTGQVLSAGALQATRDAQNMALVKAGQSAGMAVAAADMQALQRSMDEKARAEAALGLAQMKRRQAAATGVSNLAVQLAQVMQGSQPEAPLSTLGLVIDYQVPGMSEEQASRIARKIGDRKLSREQIEKIYRREGLDIPSENFFTEIT